VGYALTETRRFTIAVPGRVPLRSIEFSLVDVPDLQVLARLWPECGAIWMGAGPTPAIWHRVLRGLAWLVRFRVLLSLSFLAPLMHRAINSFGWGEHRGGMFIQIAGTDSSRSRAIRSWHLIAEGDAGPFIPSIAAEAIIRKCLRDAPPVPGARIAARELEVSDYEPLLARMPIFMGSRDDSVAESPEVPLYHCVLGRAWDDLPRTLQAMHSVTTSLVAHGRAEVIRGRGLLASLVASVMGLPRNGSDVPVEVRFAVAFASGSFSRPTIEGFFNPLDETRNSTPTIEVWHRSFANRVFSSEQFAGSGRFKHLLMERFGPLTLALAVTVEPTDTGSARLRLTVRSAAFLGIPLPSFLTPQCDASESEHAGLFHFDVALHHPLTGLIVHYRGWLVPAHATSVANRTPIN
jgi:hypothetical protein